MALRIALTLLAAQAEPAPAPPPSAPTEADIEAVMQRALAPAFEAFSNCISAGIENAPRTEPVPAAAAAIVRMCAPQREALMAAHGEFLDNAPLSDAQKARSREGWAETRRTLQSQVEAALTRLRAGQREDD